MQAHFIKLTANTVSVACSKHLNILCATYNCMGEERKHSGIDLLSTIMQIVNQRAEQKAKELAIVGEIEKLVAEDPGVLTTLNGHQILEPKIERLRDAGVKQAVPCLMNIAEKCGWQLRVVVTNALGEIGIGDSEIRKLIGIVLKDKEAFRSWQGIEGAIKSLANLHNLIVIPAIIEITIRSDPNSDHNGMGIAVNFLEKLTLRFGIKVVMERIGEALHDFIEKKKWPDSSKKAGLFYAKAAGRLIRKSNATTPKLRGILSKGKPKPPAERKERLVRTMRVGLYG